MGESVKKYRLSETGKLFFVIVGIATAVLIIICIAKAATAKEQLYATCTDYKAHGIVNITQSSPYYNPALDRDHNGVACQS